MRITTRIDKQLLEEAKREAIRQKKSLSAVIEDALRASLLRQQSILTMFRKMPGLNRPQGKKLTHVGLYFS